MTVLNITNLRHRYSEREVLNLKSWQIEAGQHALILGPSGCGKSTLLNLISGLTRVQEGDIVIGGQTLRDLKPAAADRFRAQHIGLVMQRLHLIAALNVRNNLRLTQRLAGFAVDDARIDSLLASLGLGGRGNAWPRTLSVGEAQRVALARALLNRPPLILADEPTSALDDESCEAAIALLKQQADEQGATLLIATHDQRIKAQFTEVLSLGKNVAAKENAHG